MRIPAWASRFFKKTAPWLLGAPLRDPYVRPFRIRYIDELITPLNNMEVPLLRQPPCNGTPGKPGYLVMHWQDVRRHSIARKCYGCENCREA